MRRELMGITARENSRRSGEKIWNKYL
jgi:hypothetical protein